MRSILTAFSICAFAVSAHAEVLNERDARRALFSAKGHAVQVAPGLTELQQKIATEIIPLMAQQLRQPVRYYAAIAYSPDDGMVHDSLQAAMNFHTPGAADAAAIAACNRLRSRGNKQCEVAARVVPRKFKTRALTLSIDATVGFERQYRRASAPKAFAISKTSGSWGMGRDDQSAIKSCESGAAPGDCEIVIRD